MSVARTRLRRAGAVVLAVVAALLTTTHPSSADPEPGVVVVVADDRATTFGSDCGGVFDPCGIVNNRTNRSLEAARDSKSHTGCDLWADSSKHPRKTVAAGKNSNQAPEKFKDTDCFRSTKCRVFYLGWHEPGEWVRIWSSVFVYNLNC